MKRTFPIILVAVLAVAATAEAGRWKNSLGEAQKLARDKDQLILVDMYADWCGWCKKMAREVFPSEAFQKGTEGGAPKASTTVTSPPRI